MLVVPTKGWLARRPPHLQRAARRRHTRRRPRIRQRVQPGRRGPLRRQRCVHRPAARRAASPAVDAHTGTRHIRPSRWNCTRPSGGVHALDIRVQQPRAVHDAVRSDDLGVDKPARGGAYNGGGHVVSGNTLSIAGRIGVGETPFDHPTITMAPLESPATATVHLAIAPHGNQDPTKLPDEFRLPTGTPAFWWVAMFH